MLRNYKMIYFKTKLLLKPFFLLLSEPSEAKRCSGIQKNLPKGENWDLHTLSIQSFIFVVSTNYSVCMYVCICKSSQLVDIFSFQGLKKHHNSIFSKKSLKAGAGYEIPLSKSSFVGGLV